MYFHVIHTVHRCQASACARSAAVPCSVCLLLPAVAMPPPFGTAPALHGRQVVVLSACQHPPELEKGIALRQPSGTVADEFDRD